MYQDGNASSINFPVGILEHDGDIIMVALVHDEYPTGFRPDKIFNYEMMVPVPSNTTDLQYNLFIDPFDQCPVGLEGNFSLPGNIFQGFYSSI